MIDWNRIEIEFPRRFVSAGVELNRWEIIEPYFRELEERSIKSVEELSRWILDLSELDSCIDEEQTERYVAMTCDTENPDLEKAYLEFIETVAPKCKVWWHKLRERYVGCEFRADLPSQRYEVLDRSALAQVEIFREENVPLQTEDQKLRQRYQKICGAQTVQFDGREQTLQQMARYLEEQDRVLRESAWITSGSRRLEDREALDEIFDEMIKIRHQIAMNANFPNYRDYMFRAMERYDYSPQDCEVFHDAVERIVVPAKRELDEKRKRELGLHELRPWDLAVDPKNQPPLRPFENPEQLCEGCRTIFKKLDSELSGQFQRMVELGLLDLDSRKGKAPGGYMSQFPEHRLPFIFMNAVGRHRDVETLLHESGHAFHTFACREEPLGQYRHAPMEFSEVASMSMELLSQPELGVFYDEKETRRAYRDQLEGIIDILPWVATIDAFQHWLYTRPDHSHAERTKTWLDLRKRFGGIEDYEGFERFLESQWQRQLHLYEVPFYYIEYAIAQIGSLQIWLHSRENLAQTIQEYKNGLSLGGSRPLPELFAASGIEFDFSAKTIEPLIGAVMQEIDALEDA